MVGGTGSRYYVHLARPYLEFYRLALKGMYDRVDALVAVLFGLRDVIFVPFGKMRPQVVQYVHGFVAVFGS